MTIFTLGSTSTIKLAALQAACALLKWPGTFHVVKAASGVSEQPVGYGETVRGARNRALAAKLAQPGGIAVGAENGIRRSGAPWEDVAYVVLIDVDGREVTVESEAVQVPNWAVRCARKEGFTTTTVGSVLGRRYGINPNDTFPFLTDGKVTREDVLTRAFVKLLQLVKR